MKKVSSNCLYSPLDGDARETALVNQLKELLSRMKNRYIDTLHVTNNINYENILRKLSRLEVSIQEHTEKLLQEYKGCRTIVDGIIFRSFNERRCHDAEFINFEKSLIGSSVEIQISNLRLSEKLNNELYKIESIFQLFMEKKSLDNVRIDDCINLKCSPTLKHCQERLISGIIKVLSVEKEISFKRDSDISDRFVKFMVYFRKNLTTMIYESNTFEQLDSVYNLVLMALNTNPPHERIAIYLLDILRCIYKIYTPRKKLDWHLLSFQKKMEATEKNCTAQGIINDLMRVIQGNGSIYEFCEAHTRNQKKVNRASLDKPWSKLITMQFQSLSLRKNLLLSKLHVQFDLDVLITNPQNIDETLNTLDNILSTYKQQVNAVLEIVSDDVAMLKIFQDRIKIDSLLVKNHVMLARNRLRCQVQKFIIGGYRQLSSLANEYNSQFIVNMQKDALDRKIKVQIANFNDHDQKVLRESHEMQSKKLSLLLDRLPVEEIVSDNAILYLWVIDEQRLQHLINQAVNRYDHNVSISDDNKTRCRSIVEIKNLYKELIRKYHPDKSQFKAGDCSPLLTSITERLNSLNCCLKTIAVGRNKPERNDGEVVFGSLSDLYSIIPKVGMSSFIKTQLSILFQEEQQQLNDIQNTQGSLLEQLETLIKKQYTVVHKQMESLKNTTKLMKNRSSRMECDLNQISEHITMAQKNANRIDDKLDTIDEKIAMNQKKLSILLRNLDLGEKTCTKPRNPHQ